MTVDTDIRVSVEVFTDRDTQEQVVGFLIVRNEKFDENLTWSAEYLGTLGWHELGEAELIPGYLSIPLDKLEVTVRDGYQPKHMRED